MKRDSKRLSVEGTDSGGRAMVESNNLKLDINDMGFSDP